MQAPVLVVPNAIPEGLRRELLQGFDSKPRQMGTVVTKDTQGNEKVGTDYRKVRHDWFLDDPKLMDEIRGCIGMFVLQRLFKAFRSRAQFCETEIIGRYPVGGVCMAHRDNQSLANYRQFALTCNLDDDFDGGELCFPEFGDELYRFPPGYVVMFSCGLLHEVKPITRGHRTVLVNFYFDRENNETYLKRKGGGNASRPYDPFQR